MVVVVGKLDVTVATEPIVDVEDDIVDAVYGSVEVVFGKEFGAVIAGGVVEEVVQKVKAEGSAVPLFRGTMAGVVDTTSGVIGIKIEAAATGSKLPGEEGDNTGYGAMLVIWLTKGNF